MIILIGGKARAGKDTTGDFVIEKYEQKGKKVCKVQIGQYIKYYAMKYFGWDGAEETKPRDLLNKLATEIIREKIDPEFHVKRLIEDIKVLSYFYDVFVVTDVRFPIEIEKVKEEFNNVYTIKVIRDSDELDEKQKAHVSETALDDYENFDFTINNNGTLENLEEKVIDIIEEIGD